MFTLLMREQGNKSTCKKVTVFSSHAGDCAVMTTVYTWVSFEVMNHNFMYSTNGMGVYLHESSLQCDYDGISSSSCRMPASEMMSDR